MLSKTSARCRNKIYIWLGTGNRKQKGIYQNVNLEIRNLSGCGEIVNFVSIFSAGSMDSVVSRSLQGGCGFLWSLAGVCRGWGRGEHPGL